MRVRRCLRTCVCVCAGHVTRIFVALSALGMIASAIGFDRYSSRTGTYGHDGPDGVDVRGRRGSALQRALAERTLNLRDTHSPRRSCADVLYLEKGPSPPPLAGEADAHPRRVGKRRCTLEKWKIGVDCLFRGRNY